jgi:hypothetical protein
MAGLGRILQDGIMSRPHGHAKVDRNNPQAWGVCDDCGFLYNLRDLNFQYGWAGARIQRINFLKCPKCTDKLQEQLRVIHLPADPEPVPNPRPELYNVLDNPLNGIGITYGVGHQPVFGTMSEAAGLVAAFDGNPTKPFFLCAVSIRSTTGDNIVGRSWPDAARAIGRIVVYGPTDGRLFGGGSTAWKFQGSNDGFNFTTIISGTTLGTVREVIDQQITGYPYYSYHRFVLTGDGINSVSIAQVQIYQAGERSVDTSPAILTGSDGSILLGADGAILLGATP